MSLESSIGISRSWEMPNKNTFKMLSASNILKKYVTSGIWLDPLLMLVIQMNYVKLML